MYQQAHFVVTSHQTWRPPQKFGQRQEQGELCDVLYAKGKGPRNAASGSQTDGNKMESDLKHVVKVLKDLICTFGSIVLSICLLRSGWELLPHIPSQALGSFSSNSFLQFVFCKTIIYCTDHLSWQWKVQKENTFSAGDFRIFYWLSARIKASTRWMLASKFDVWSRPGRCSSFKPYFRF